MELGDRSAAVGRAILDALWIAVALPRLPLDVFLRGGLLAPSHQHSPHAAVDARMVLAVNAAAAACGVQPGMSLTTAYALVPHLVAKRRDPPRERDALEAAATWAAQFTPNVVIRDDMAGATSLAGLQLEISGSLKLFGGLAPIRDGLASGLDALGVAATYAVAPTARGAWWLNRAGMTTPITDVAVLTAALTRLPIGVLDCSSRILNMLEAIGARTIGDVVALPRAGFARRFGPELLEALDEATGRRPTAHRYFEPPERFHAKLELPALVENAQALVFAYRRLFVQLEGLLRARASGVEQLALVMQHEDHTDSTLTLGLVVPASSAEHFTTLARERLERFTLPASVHTIRLVADVLVPLAGGNLQLFEDTLQRENDWAKLVERLRARLGVQAVQGLTIAAEHRPEYVAHAIEPRAAASRKTPDPPNFGPRPLWLLAQPRPLLERNAQPFDDGPLTLLAGPERIESGWWDGGDIARDYFIATRTDRSLVWIYRERQSVSSAATSATSNVKSGWFLHGLFA